MGCGCYTFHAGIYDLDGFDAGINECEDEMLNTCDKSVNATCTDLDIGFVCSCPSVGYQPLANNYDPCVGKLRYMPINGVQRLIELLKTFISVKRIGTISMM